MKSLKKTLFFFCLLMFQFQILECNLILIRKDLRNHDFSNQDLREAFLFESNLQGVDLSGRDLTKVRFCGASLKNANLKDAILNGADLTNANLQGANLEGASLVNAILRHALLDRSINWKFANLYQAKEFNPNYLLELLFQNICRTIVSEDIQGVYFRKIELLKNVSCRSRKLSNLIFNSCPFRNCNFINAKFNEVSFVDGSFRNVTFAFAEFKDVVFYEVDLSGVNFNNLKCKNVYFVNCDLSGSRFIGADLSDAYFYNCDLSEVDFFGAYVEGAEFVVNHEECHFEELTDGFVIDFDVKHNYFDNQVVPGCFENENVDNRLIVPQAEKIEDASCIQRGNIDCIAGFTQGQMQVLRLLGFTG